MVTYRCFTCQSASDINQGVKPTIIFYLVPRLRMCGHIPPFSNVFMTWRLIEQRENFTFLEERCVTEPLLRM